MDFDGFEGGMIGYDTDTPTRSWSNTQFPYIIYLSGNRVFGSWTEVQLHHPSDYYIPWSGFSYFMKQRSQRVSMPRGYAYKIGIGDNSARVTEIYRSYYLAGTQYMNQGKEGWQYVPLEISFVPGYTKFWMSGLEKLSSNNHDFYIVIRPHFTGLGNVKDVSLSTSCEWIIPDHSTDLRSTEFRTMGTSGNWNSWNEITSHAKRNVIYIEHITGDGDTTSTFAKQGAIEVGVGLPGEEITVWRNYIFAAGSSIYMHNAMTPRPLYIPVGSRVAYRSVTTDSSHRNYDYNFKFYYA